MKMIHHVVDIDTPVSTIWSALTEVQGLTSWWSTGLNTSKAEVGTLLHWTFAGDFNPVMEITTLDGERELGWRCIDGHTPWKDNIFRFQLVKIEDGHTRLRFWQDYAVELDDDSYGNYNFNWGYYLESLRLLCSTGKGNRSRFQHSTYTESSLLGTGEKLFSKRRGKHMTNDGSNSIKAHPVVSHEEWLSARTAFLAKEKEFTRLRDELSRQRRELPWEMVDKQYVFDSPQGKETLVELFANRSQLIVYHFMFAPDWDEGCPHCSFWADNFNGIGVHLNHRDVTFVAISRAEFSKIESFKKRMGWSFKWVSSFQSDFNFDYQASFTPEEVHSGAAFFNYTRMDTYDTDREGISVFYKDESGAVFHTYSCYARGIDMMNGTYHYLDLVPKGRDEKDLEGPQDWVRYHDRYED